MTVVSNHLVASTEPESHMWMLGGNRIRTWHSRLPVAAGVFVAAVGAVALSGWAFHVAPLRAEFPGFAAIKPSAAIFLLLSGLALALMADRDAPRRRRILGLVCVSVAAGWVAVDVIEFVLAAAFGQDNLIFTGLSSLTHLPFARSTSVWYLVLFGLLGGIHFS